MSMMQEAVRIADNFLDRRNPDSIQRQGKLYQSICLVMVFYAIMGIAFIKLEEAERKRGPRIIHDVDVQFEYNAPPPDPEYRVDIVPKPISLTAGENIDPGSEAAPKPAEAEKASMPAIEAPETQPKPTQEQARPEVSRETTVAPPVAVASTNEIKAAPVAAPKQAPTKAPPAENIGAASTLPVSGAPQAGGLPDGAEGGTGTGGQGTDGSGTGEGDPGAGQGFGKAGGNVLTKIEGSRGQAMGNIAPYRKDMLIRLAQNWQPKKKTANIIMLLVINKEGRLVNAEIFQGSGSKKADREAIAAAEMTEFAPLPEWYRGETLTFKIELSKVEALQQ